MSDPMLDPATKAYTPPSSWDKAVQYAVTHDATDCIAQANGDALELTRLVTIRFGQKYAPKLTPEAIEAIRNEGWLD